MCHIVLLLPLIGLPIFWFVPLPVAVPVYALLSLAALWVYFQLAKTWHEPVRTGREGLLHAPGEVIDAASRKVLVRIMGEIWQAKSKAPLHVADSVEVTGIHGLVLSVAPRTETPSPARMSAQKEGSK